MSSESLLVLECRCEIKHECRAKHWKSIFLWCLLILTSDLCEVCILPALHLCSHDTESFTLCCEDSGGRCKAHFTAEEYFPKFELMVALQLEGNRRFVSHTLWSELKAAFSLILLPTRGTQSKVKIISNDSRHTTSGYECNFLNRKLRVLYDLLCAGSTLSPPNHTHSWTPQRSSWLTTAQPGTAPCCRCRSHTWGERL